MIEFHNNIFEYLNKLKSNSKPEFGKMSAQHMVEHLGINYFIAVGKLNLPIITPEEKLESYKDFLMSDRPFKKGIKLGLLSEDIEPVKFESLVIAIEKLKNVWNKFNLIHAKEDFYKDHPIFGNLSYLEWMQLLGKHNHHHLLQFNLV